MGTEGLLYIGDCKMGSLETRAYVAHTGNHYLCPLAAVQVPPMEMERLLKPVWKKEQKLTPVFRPQTCEEIAREEKKETLASGFAYEVILQDKVEGKSIEWEEQRLVVHSEKHGKSQQKGLDSRLEKAQNAIAELNRKGRGRKALREEEYPVAVEKIMKKYRVGDILKADYQTEVHRTGKRAWKERPARVVEKVTITVQSEIDPSAYQNRVRSLGWRVYVCNDLQLDLIEAVLAYREEYLIERGFGRYKGKALGLTPLYLGSEERKKGLVRLLSIGLRILCLLEFSVRKSLSDKNEKLSGIYRGNPRRATARPTAEIMLKAFEWITLTEVHINGVVHRCLSALSVAQERILELIGLPLTIYLALSG
jgi:transposase